MAQKNICTLRISIHRSRSNSKDLSSSCKVRTEQQIIFTRKKTLNKKHHRKKKSNLNDRIEKPIQQHHSSAEVNLEKNSRLEYVSNSPSNDFNLKNTNLNRADQVRNWHKKKYYRRLLYSPCCIFSSILGVMLFLIGLAAAFIGLFSAHNLTTTSTMVTSSTSSTSTVMTTTITITTTMTTSSTSSTTTTTTKTTTTTITTMTTSSTSSTTTTTTKTTTTTTTTTITTTSVTTSTLTTDTTTTTCSSVFNSTSGLVAYFPMDSSPSYLTDVGGTPTATALSVTNVPGERNQALLFQGTINSYFQSSSFVSLGTPNAPFTIAAYISPNNLTGTIVHISKYRNGTSGWCLPFIGFASTTEIAIQIWGGSTASYVLGPILPLNSWTHVVQTYSSTNGLCLYINGTLYAQSSTSTSYAASGVPNYLTLGSTLDAIPYPISGCSTTGVLGGLGYYSGIIDELRVYNRELSFLEVCALAKY